MSRHSPAPIVSVYLDGGHERFRPGDLVSGKAVVTCQQEWLADYAEVVLFWRTEGKGELCGDIAGRDEMVEPGSMAPCEVEHRFSFTVPQMPWSYNGQLIKIQWIVGVFVCAKGGKEQSIEAPIIVHPQPEKV